MGQKKLQRFEDLKTFPNVFQYPESIKGKWSYYFKNSQPIVLELACGKGEYTIGLAQLYPAKNFVGIDIKGNRIWVGAKKAMKENLSNTAFLRIQIESIADYFAPGEVSEIWITFPDPQLRTGKAKKRLTHPKFLRLYSGIMKPGGYIHLKTDSPALYNFTRIVIGKYHCDLLEDRDNLQDAETHDELKIKTHYELLDISKSSRIYYLKFSLPENFPEKEKDKELQVYLKENEPKGVN